MKDVLYLAWRYLAYNRFKTAILIFAIMLIPLLSIAIVPLTSLPVGR